MDERSVKLGEGFLGERSIYIDWRASVFGGPGGRQKNRHRREKKYTRLAIRKISHRANCSGGRGIWIGPRQQKNGLTLTLGARQV